MKACSSGTDFLDFIILTWTSQKQKGFTTKNTKSTKLFKKNLFFVFFVLFVVLYFLPKKHEFKLLETNSCTSTQNTSFDRRSPRFLFLSYFEAFASFSAFLRRIEPFGG